MHYEIFQRERRGGHVYVAARFWETEQDFRAEKPPALINDFRLHLRGEHQRIRRGPAGGLLHRGGAEVTADVRSFRKSTAAIPWQREVYTRSHDELIATELRAYGARAFARGWHGDRRGTTSVYQVAASTDDGFLDNLGGYHADWPQTVVGESEPYVQQFESWYRFTGVSELGGRQINSAILELWGANPDSGTPYTDLFFAKATSPSVPADSGDYFARTRSNAVAWNSPGLSTTAWTSSPELAPIVQEVVDDYDPTALLVFHQTGFANANSDQMQASSWDNSSEYAAKLTIDSVLGRTPRTKTVRPIYQR